MTLTAIDRDLKIYNPAAEISANPESSQGVIEATIIAQREIGLFCPHCYQWGLEKDGTEQWAIVRFRKGVENADGLLSRRPHFFHPSAPDSSATPSSQSFSLRALPPPVTPHLVSPRTAAQSR